MRWPRLIEALLGYTVGLLGAYWDHPAPGLTQAARAGAVKITRGSAEEAAKVLDLFDKFEPARTVTIPTLHD